MGLAKIQDVFNKHEEDRPLINIYITAGYPNLESTGVLLKTLSAAQVDFIELGMPYSDPLADGPTIQASSAVALKNGITLERIFAQVKAVRAAVKPPIILMGYYNQVLQYGVNRFLSDCKSAGIDGLILPDLPLEVYELELENLIIQADLGISFLVSPRTPTARVNYIDRLSRGFVYVVSSSSTTGSAEKTALDSSAYFERLNEIPFQNPKMIGFNIRTKENLMATLPYARGGIIGSAFIKALGPNTFEADALSFIKALR